MHVNPSYRGPGLPVTRNMPFITASMPNRQQPRNMTGIYLGLEGNIKPPGSRSAVPPLARGRGLSSRIRTPAEERRYLSELDRERKAYAACSAKIAWKQVHHGPASDVIFVLRARYPMKMVEVLRLKEEKKGFSGQPLRKKTCRPETSACPREYLSSARKWGPAKRIDSRNVDELIRTNPRKYTHIANSGVTRSENLTGWLDFQTDEVSMAPIPNHVIESATSGDDLTGLGECYKKVCQGRIETLHSLLPTSSSTSSQHHLRNTQQRIHREQSAYRGTGFTVRSYRNPNQAEIVADFPLPKTTGRPQTVPIRRPHVPQPYFFQFYNQSKLIAPNSAHFPKVNGVSPDDGGHAVRIFASPGVGSLSRTLHLQGAASEPDHHHSHKVADSPPPSFCRTFHGAAADSQQLAISMPLSGNHQISEDNKTNLSVTVGQTDESVSESRLSQRSETEDVKMDDGYMTGGGCDSVVTDVKEYQDELFVGRTLKSSSSGADITVGLEKEDGTADEVEIDDVEAIGAELEPVETESPKGNVRKASIVDKLVKTKQSEAIIATLKENAEQRQKDFQKLLNEHAEIVQEIGRTASSENLISQAEHGERDH